MDSEICPDFDIWQKDSKPTYQTSSQYIVWFQQYLCFSTSKLSGQDIFK
jgi:hypothetical protein